MLCQICHTTEATVYLLETVNAKPMNLHICENCAQKRHLGEMLSKPAMAIHELLASILQLGAASEASVADLKCPRCGLGYLEFTRSGRFGCPTCYQAFRERLLPLLRQFHQAEEHLGRDLGEALPELTEEVSALKEKIRSAVDAENFELAASLRDEIKQLEGMAGI